MKPKETVETLSDDSVIVRKPRGSKAFIEDYWKPREKPPGVLCANFKELLWSYGCRAACRFCYLRGTFRGLGWKGKKQVVWTNTDRLWAEVDEFLKTPKPTICHTGEISDSLAPPRAPEFIAELASKFAAAKTPHRLLSLSKFHFVDPLLEVGHNGRTCVAFSVNPEPVVKEFEVNTSSLEQRMAAAEKCIDAGYPVMLRVDPIIPIPGWERVYAEYFDRLNDLKLLGVVVGTLRAYRNLFVMLDKDVRGYLKKFSKENGRFHVENGLRSQVYDFAFQRLKHTRVGVCKETGAVWGNLAKQYHKTFICNCLCWGQP